MTVPVTDTRIQYIANNGQTIFDYPFRIFKAEDLQVYLTPVGQTPDPAIDLLTLNIDYTVTGVNDLNGGTIVLTTGAAEDDIITINRNILIDRETDFSVGGEFKPSTINNQLDKLTTIAQQLNTLDKQRQLTYQVTDELTENDTVLPQLGANQIWAKNGVGKLIAASLEECEDCSTLRSELASETELAPGAELIGFYKDGVGGTNLDALLKELVSKVNSLENSTNSTGTAAFTIETTQDLKPGWVLMDDGTIGSASSGATTRANADTENLYTMLWNNVADTYAPVSGGRGASASADFEANKSIAILKVLGRVLAVAGQGSGLSLRAIGETLGVEQVTLVGANVHDHTHNIISTSPLGADLISASGVTDGSTGGGSAIVAQTSALEAGSGGANTPHQNMQPTSFWNVKIKL